MPIIIIIIMIIIAIISSPRLSLRVSAATDDGTRHHGDGCDGDEDGALLLDTESLIAMGWRSKRKRRILGEQEG